MTNYPPIVDSSIPAFSYDGRNAPKISINKNNTSWRNGKICKAIIWILWWGLSLAICVLPGCEGC